MHLDLLQEIRKEPLQKDLLKSIQKRIAAEQAEQLPPSTTLTVLVFAGLLLFANAFFVVQNFNQKEQSQETTLITNMKSDNQLYQ